MARGILTKSPGSMSIRVPLLINEWLYGKSCCTITCFVKHTMRLNENKMARKHDTISDEAYDT